MTAQPLQEDTTFFDLTNDKVIDGPWPAAQTPAAVLSNPDELAKPKKPRKRKSATGRKRGRPVKKPITEIVEAVPELQTAAVATLHRVANGGESIASRVRRINGDTWLIVAACFAAIALGTSIAFMVIR